MQSTRPTHHANASRSLFQNPWTLTDSIPGTSTYLPAFPNTLNLSTFLTIPNIPLERVRNSISHPHPPVKVIKPDWGNSTSNSASSNPNLKATWLGHAVRRSSPFSVPHHFNTLFFLFPRVSSSSFRVLLEVQSTSHLASCSIPSSQSAPVLLHGWAFDVACLLLAL
jgi:hypothetical protein